MHKMSRRDPVRWGRTVSSLVKSVLVRSGEDSLTRRAARAVVPQHAISVTMNRRRTLDEGQVVLHSFMP